MSEWRPDWVLIPGEVLYDHLDESGSSVEDFESATGLPPRVVAGILDGTEPITEEIAEALFVGTGISSQFWLNLEQAYREGLAAGKTPI